MQSLPESLLAFGRSQRLEVGEKEIWFSESQGPEHQAVLSIDRWMTMRNGTICVETRYLQRSSPEANWHPVDGEVTSEPLTDEAARSILAFWGAMQDIRARVANEYERRRYQNDSHIPDVAPVL